MKRLISFWRLAISRKGSQRTNVAISPPFVDMKHRKG
jgi:hypothetical protein